MPTASVHSAFHDGAAVRPVRVEVLLSPGLPVFTLIGLPDRQVGEAAVRVRSAIVQSGFSFPKGRVTANLHPAGLRKSSTGFDLALACAILAASGQAPALVAGCWAYGEVGLDGSVLPDAAAAAVAAAALGPGVPLLSPLRPEEIAAVGGGSAATIEHLRFLAGACKFRRIKASPIPSAEPLTSYSIDRISGLKAAKRCLLIALASRHHLLLSGPPGIGKTLLARASAELLPPLGRAGYAAQRALGASGSPPFIAPHHRLSKAGLLDRVRPYAAGLLAAADGGVLFLDELPELPAETLVALREPMEDGVVRIPRGGALEEVAARPVVIGARNPCRCGRLGTAEGSCSCSARETALYASRLNAPLLDRFALHCEVEAPGTDPEEPEPLGDAYRRAVTRVRSAKPPGWGDAAELACTRAERLLLSRRARAQLRDVSETICLLGGGADVQERHVFEALQYRRVAP